MTRDPVLYCSHCGNSTPHALALRHECEDREFYNYDGSKEHSLSMQIIYEARICATCDNLTLYREDEISAPELVWPSSHDLHRSVPEAVREAYGEACRVRSSSPSAYAVLLRKALEVICDDRGVRGENLGKRLAELSQRGEIPPVLAEATSILRIIGNAGAHHSTERVTMPLTWGMDHLFKAVVEFVYVAPSRVADFRESVKRRDEALRKPIAPAQPAPDGLADRER